MTVGDGRGGGSARGRIMDAAFPLLYAHGLHGVGVDLVIARAGVARATFYKHFPSKDDLILAYIDTVDRRWFADLRSCAEAAGDDPRAQLVGVFGALPRVCRRDGYRGCPLINAAVESEPGSRVHARTVAHQEKVQAWLACLARGAGAADPEWLAAALVLLLHGGLARGALDGDPGMAEIARAAASTLVEAACPADDGPANA